MQEAGGLWTIDYGSPYGGLGVCMDSHMKIDFLYIYIYLYPDCTKYMHRCYTVTVTVTGAIRAPPFQIGRLF